MIIRLTGLYGLEDTKAYFRERGDCFDFVNDIRFASNLTEEDAVKIIDSGEWYKKLYAATGIEIIEMEV